MGADGRLLAKPAFVKGWRRCCPRSRRSSPRRSRSVSTGAPSRSAAPACRRHARATRDPWTDSADVSLHAARRRGRPTSGDATWTLQPAVPHLGAARRQPALRAGYRRQHGAGCAVVAGRALTAPHRGDAHLAANVGEEGSATSRARERCGHSSARRRRLGVLEGAFNRGVHTGVCRAAAGSHARRSSWIDF
jgi:hypothetical protein